ncbi:unnamed protein product, partial [marine sediment metagenome]
LHLARWLSQAERLWRAHRRSDMTFQKQLDYYGKLSAQFPTHHLRVAYAASGTLPAVTLLTDPEAICEHALYWTAVETEQEGLYLTAILNSETARARVAKHQALGQWGARHFDKVMLSLPIPTFNAKDSLHQRLTRAARRAARVSAAVELREGEHFVRARQRIRAALREDGVDQAIDRLVAELL